MFTKHIFYGGNSIRSFFKRLQKGEVVNNILFVFLSLIETSYLGVFEMIYKSAFANSYRTNTRSTVGARIIIFRNKRMN